MKILIIGPLNEPITGVSVSNDLLEKRLSADSINTSLPFFEENVGRFSFKKMMLNFSFYLKMYKLFKTDIVYLTPGQSFLGVVKYLPYIVFGKLLKKQIVVHLHGNSLLKTFSELHSYKKYIFQCALRKCTKGIVLSTSLKKNLTPFILPENIFSISNFVESKFVLSREEFEEKPKNDLNILCLSNLMTEKGVFVFFKVINHLREMKVSYKCKMAGNIDDKIKENVLKKIEEDNNIEYLGVVRNKEKRDLLKWGRVFIFPSTQIEGLPISILEAMGTGNHIISTKQDALLDVFKNKEINYVNIGSWKDISRLIINDNFSDDQLNNNHKLIIDKFGEDQFVNNILNVFKSK